MSEYAGIETAILELAYSGGFIDRINSEQAVLARSLAAVQASINSDELKAANHYLLSLEYEELVQLCSGEVWNFSISEARKVDALLNIAFEAL